MRQGFLTLHPLRLALRRRLLENHCTSFILMLRQRGVKRSICRILKLEITMIDRAKIAVLPSEDVRSECAASDAPEQLTSE